jgi:hypothetical protein
MTTEKKICVVPIQLAPAQLFIYGGQNGTPRSNGSIGYNRANTAISGGSLLPHAKRSVQKQSKRIPTISPVVEKLNISRAGCLE